VTLGTGRKARLQSRGQSDESASAELPNLSCIDGDSPRGPSVLKIIGSQWGNLLLRIVSALALTPFLILELGADGYGAWVFLNAIIGYLTMLQGGLPAASLRHLSEKLGQKDHEGFNNTLASSLTLFGAMAGIVTLVAGVLLAISGLVTEVPARWATDGRAAFALATLAIATTLIANSFMTVLEAHGDYIGRNLIEMSATLVRTGLTVGLLLWRPSLTFVAVSVLAGELLTLVSLMVFIRRRYEHVRIGLSGRDRETISSLFSFSIVVFLLAMGARIAYKTDALVIGVALPMGAVSVYSVANTLALYLSRLVNGVAEPLMPKATKLRQRGAETELQALFLKWSKVSMSLGLLVGLFLVFLGPAFISWWINPKFGDEVGDVLRILVASFILMLPTSAVGFRFLLGLTRPLNMAVTYVVAGLLNLGISALLVTPYGLVGVAIGTAAPNVLLAIVVMQLCCREIGVPVSTYLGYVVARPLLGSLPIAALLLFFERTLPVKTFLGLAISGSVHVVVFAAVWVLLVYRNDPHLDLGARLRAWRKRG
jgi:O-antigen/teichoic acid export membrane protein